MSALPHHQPTPDQLRREITASGHGLSDLTRAFTGGICTQTPERYATQQRLAAVERALPVAWHLKRLHLALYENNHYPPHDATPDQRRAFERFERARQYMRRELRDEYQRVKHALQENAMPDASPAPCRALVVYDPRRVALVPFEAPATNRRWPSPQVVDQVERESTDRLPLVRDAVAGQDRTPAYADIVRGPYHTLAPDALRELGDAEALAAARAAFDNYHNPAISAARAHLSKWSTQS